MQMAMEEDPASDTRRRFRDYLLALEEERRKIHVFQRELPLCLDLVTQTIEGMKSQMDAVVGSEETVSDHGPVLEEFIPLKPSLSLCSSEEESTHAVAPVNSPKKDESERARPPTPETKKAMPDWLQSVQLWSQEPQQSCPNKELPCKPVALNATKTRGAFHPFEKEKRAEPELPASSTTAAASSAVVGDSCGDKATSDTEVAHEKIKDTNKDMEKDSKEGQSSQQQHNRKARRCWAPELHRRFLQALQQLGGSHVATPKQIRELMKVDGLTNDEVKSHLQKYRLHTTRRPSSTVAQSNNAAQAAAPQFVVVGSCIWVPPQEYAAAAAQQQANNNSPAVVYAPVATMPSSSSALHVPSKKKQTTSRGSKHSEDQRSGDASSSSGSPAVSSSSQTTSA
ncbi:transcription factor NIGT1 [Brachypodium distachyon]|uniref:HTH myb-type domain-containing protein n=1 Tax=Brachypodium distachyon TaxID=15368 RepID=I1HZP0_BRADI|nr:transcription factor NIGT1 [Brachypodium distachyon]KQJ94471.1 hypothetical protein BRADI_3g10730v3 [Brachypodium distachyon]|eukprot:XP_003572723.1 transcription factor NIGT1 [Brachypodium distachyon]